MKKEYLKPEITIVTFSSSVHLMAGSGGPGLILCLIQDLVAAQVPQNSNLKMIFKETSDIPKPRGQRFGAFFFASTDLFSPA